MSTEMIKQNIQTIRRMIKEATDKSVRLVAVSKTKPIEDVLAAYETGQRHFGENVQELIEKSQKLPEDIQWHFIGSIQSNKIKSICSIPNLYIVETVDSEKKAQLFEKACLTRNTPLKIYLQNFKIAKSGIPPSEIVQLAQHVLENCPHLQLAGLMTIGSPESSKSELNPDFELLASLKNQIEQKFKLSLELSMGMSDDFLLAIKQGSNNVRVGSSIFGARYYPKKS